LREENSDLRSCQEELQRELNSAVSDRDKYKKDYKSLKQVNRALEKDIREVRNIWVYSRLTFLASWT